MEKNTLFQISFLNPDEEEPKIYILLDSEHCPLCEEPLLVNGRCKTCPECGWSGCDL